MGMRRVWRWQKAVREALDDGVKKNSNQDVEKRIFKSLLTILALC
jgi:hypothetical protein